MTDIDLIKTEENRLLALARDIENKLAYISYCRSANGGNLRAEDVTFAIFTEDAEELYQLALEAIENRLRAERTR